MNPIFAGAGGPSSSPPSAVSFLGRAATPSCSSSAFSSSAWPAAPEATLILTSVWLSVMETEELRADRTSVYSASPSALPTSNVSASASRLSDTTGGGSPRSSWKQSSSSMAILSITVSWMKACRCSCLATTSGTSGTASPMQNMRNMSTYWKTTKPHSRSVMVTSSSQTLSITNEMSAALDMTERMFMMLKMACQVPMSSAGLASVRRCWVISL
mmetsp:Transcript_42630/g.66689  ORF Transcript_42630/g.66689 Transcript_42630/m.66689 type:complete len:215 (-) Transcript_42630:1157-1801(-)